MAPPKRTTPAKEVYVVRKAQISNRKGAKKKR